MNRKQERRATSSVEPQFTTEGDRPKTKSRECKDSHLDLDSHLSNKTSGCCVVRCKPSTCFLSFLSNRLPKETVRRGPVQKFVTSHRNPMLHPATLLELVKQGVASKSATFTSKKFPNSEIFSK